MAKISRAPRKPGTSHRSGCAREKNLWAELYPPNDPSSPDDAEPTEALLTRRYALTVRRNAGSSHVETWPLTLDVTLRGPIDPVTGRVTDITALDHRVREQVLNHLTGTNVSQLQELTNRPVTLPNLAKVLWSRLLDVADARLERLRLTDHHDLTLGLFGVKHTGLLVDCGGANPLLRLR